MWQLLKEDVACIFDRDPAARNLFDVLTCYSGLHALLLHRINHGLWSRGLRWAPRFLSTLGRWLTGIEIHPAARIGRRFFVDHGTGVVIGETAEIGDDVTLYQGVTLGGRTLDEGKRHPTLGNNVVVGAGAKILGPFEVGDDARVGSNAVVLESVPKGATVVGVPAHVVRCRDADQRCLELVRANTEKRLVRPAFDAYGVPEAATEDPVALELEALRRDVGRLRIQLAALQDEADSEANAAANPSERREKRATGTGCC